MTVEEIKTLNAMLSLCKSTESTDAPHTLLIIERLIEHLLYEPSKRKEPFSNQPAPNACHL